MKLLERTLASIRRRIALQIGRFLLAAVDDSGADAKGRVTIQRVDGQVFAGERELQNRSHFQPYGLSAHPIPGAEGLAYAVGGSRSHVVVANIDDPRHRPTNLAEGEVALYTDERLALLLKRGDEIEMRGDTLDAAFDDEATLATTSGNLLLASISGDVYCLSWLATAKLQSAAGACIVQAGTTITLQAPSIVVTGALAITGNVAITGSLTINGKTVDDTHTHVGSLTAPIGAQSNTGAVV